MCGPMVHHVYRVEKGCLVRFSLLPGGAVKKAQMLGGKLRLMSFEWTHLSCPKNVYEKMVERMQLKIPHRLPEEKLKEKIAERYGQGGSCGLLNKGMTKEAAVKIMGEAKEDKNGIMLWKGRSGDYRTEVRAAFKNNKLSHIVDDSRTYSSRVPIKNTASWVRYYLDDDQKEAFKKLDEKAFMGSVVRLLEKAESKSEKDNIIYMAAQLADEHKLTDERILQTVLKLEKGDSGGFSLLQTYVDLKSVEQVTVDDWVLKQLESMVDEDIYSSDEKANMFYDPIEARQEFFADLLEHVADKDEEKAKTLLAKFVKAGNPSWYSPLLEVIDEVDAEQRVNLVLNAFNKGVELKSYSLVITSLEAVPKVKFGPEDKKKLLKKITDLPEGEEGEDWVNARKEAIKHLK